MTGIIGVGGLVVGTNANALGEQGLYIDRRPPTRSDHLI